MAETTEYEARIAVEDGRGLADANSYVSVSYADLYARNRNWDTWLSQSRYVRSAAVIKATDYVDSLFQWKGSRKFRDQSLSFPRVNIMDSDGFLLDGEIPERLRRAVCEAAFQVVDQYTLFLKRDADGPLKKSRKKADVAEIEKEYFSNKEFKVDYTSSFQSLDSMLRGLYWRDGERNTVNQLARWC